MTTLRTPPVSKLGIQLQNYRADRPDEWNMDEFTRSAEAMALRIKELEADLVGAKAQIKVYDDQYDYDQDGL
jgi:hypothetical protein